MNNDKFRINFQITYFKLSSGGVKQVSDYYKDQSLKKISPLVYSPFQAYLRGSEIYHRQRRAHEIFYCPTDIFVLKYSAWRQERQKLNFHGRRHLTVIPIIEIPENRHSSRSEERRVGKECRSRWSPYH